MQAKRRESSSSKVKKRLKIRRDFLTFNLQNSHSFLKDCKFFHSFLNAISLSSFSSLILPSFPPFQIGKSYDRIKYNPCSSKKVGEPKSVVTNYGVMKATYFIPLYFAFSPFCRLQQKKQKRISIDFLCVTLQLSITYVYSIRFLMISCQNSWVQKEALHCSPLCVILKVLVTHTQKFSPPRNSRSQLLLKSVLFLSLAVVASLFFPPVCSLPLSPWIFTL